MEAQHCWDQHVCTSNSFFTSQWGPTCHSTNTEATQPTLHRPYDSEALQTTTLSKARKKPTLVPAREHLPTSASPKQLLRVKQEREHHASGFAEIVKGAFLLSIVQEPHIAQTLFRKRCTDTVLPGHNTPKHENFWRLKTLQRSTPAMSVLYSCSKLLARSIPNRMDTRLPLLACSSFSSGICPDEMQSRPYANA